MNFMDLEQPEYSYMFGFLQADGTLSAGPGQKGRLSVELSAVDRELLLRFQELCPYPSSVRDRTRTTNFKRDHTSSTWSMCSLEGRTTVNALGLPYGRKSRTIAPPAFPHQPRDYVRGLLDADGALGITATGQPFVSLTASSDAIARYFVDFAQLVSGAQRNPRRNRRDDIYNIVYSNEQAVAFANELYYTGALALARKAARAEQVRTWVRPPAKPRARGFTCRRWTPEEDAVVLAHKPRFAAPMLQRSARSCSVRRYELRKHAEAE